MNKTFRKIVGGVLAVTALMGLSACGSKTEDNKAEGKTFAAKPARAKPAPRPVDARDTSKRFTPPKKK